MRTASNWFISACAALPLAGLHPGLDPVQALHVLGRLYAFQRVVLGVADRDLAVDRARAAVGGSGHRLVAFAELHHDLAGGRIENEEFEWLDPPPGRRHATARARAPFRGPLSAQQTPRPPG